jgi:tight adherence protein B
MNIIIVGAVLFVMAVFVIEMSFLAYRIIQHPDHGKIHRRLKQFSSVEYGDKTPGILKKRVLSAIPFIHGFLLRVTGIERLERLIRQTDSKYPPGFFILLTLVLSVIGLACSSLMQRNHLVSLSVAALSGAIPFFYLVRKKSKRMDKFVNQLPEGLDLIARSLRAGHAFTTGMKMVADEFEDPLGTEFGQTLDEINFGVSVQDALRAFADRIDCPDLKYFVVSVILQRETGGNLAEIVESIAYLIRERFKLQGKIRTLSAEGKLSAIVLVALPGLFVVAMRFINPEYINTLFTEPEGKLMVGIAMCMIVLGALVMKKMIKIKV